MSLSVPQAQYTGLSTDPKPIPTDAVVGTKYYELDTKLVYYWTGSAWKVWKQSYKEGRYTGISGNLGSDNILENNLTIGGHSFGRVFDPIYGLHQHISTSNTSGAYAGIRSTNLYCEPRQNPYLRIVFALDTGGSLTGFNFFAGWSGYLSGLGDNNGGADDIYPNNKAFGLKFRDGETDFKIYHNDGTSPGTIGAAIGAANSPTLTSIHTFEARVIGGELFATTTFQYKFDHAPSWTTITGDLPDNLSSFGLQIWMQTTIAAFKLFRLVDIYTRTDNKG